MNTEQNTVARNHWTPWMREMGTYQFPRSALSSRVTIPRPRTVRKTSVLSCTDGLVLLYTETIDGAPMYHVGNPFLRQWVRIPLLSHLPGYDFVRLHRKIKFSATLESVTKMERGTAVGYKVLWMLTSRCISKELTFMIYSSETGLWGKPKRCIVSVTVFGLDKSSRFHWLDPSYRMISIITMVMVLSVILYLFLVLSYMDSNHPFKRTITTSAGSVVYCHVCNDNGGCTIRVWRLLNYCNDNPMAEWKLDWEVNTKSSLVGFGADYFPLVMHPFNSEIIYLWSKTRMVSSR